jgi:hypothetical protein
MNSEALTKFEGTLYSVYAVVDHLFA